MDDKFKKEDLYNSLQELKESFIEDKTTSEKFSDEQVGTIKCWLEEAYALGFRNGKIEGVANNISDKHFERYTDAMRGMFDNDNSDITQLKKLLVYERQINSIKDAEVKILLYMIDKDNFGESISFCCL